MKIFYSLLFILSLFLLLSSCSKDNQRTSIAFGDYTGTFKVIYSSETKTGPVTLKLTANTFTCSNNPDRIPAGGSGNYTATADSITFSDINYWTGDFDWNLILTGKYAYTFDGRRLKIWAEKNGVGYYEYDLQKQN